MAQNLPKALSPAELSTLTASAPPGLEIVDVRPPDEFANYHLPGSENIEPVVVLKDPGLIYGLDPLVLVDADGSLAPALAGMLYGKTKRQVLFLRGGLLAWWQEQELSLSRKHLKAPIKPKPEEQP